MMVGRKDLMHMRIPALILALLLVATTQVQAGDRIRITNGEWLPFFSEGLHDFGPPSKVVTDAFALEGIKVEFGFFPWKRSYMLSFNGDWDGAIGWPYGAERAKSHYYSKHPINSGKWVFFHRKDTHFEARSVDQLKTFSYGVTIGDWVMDGDDVFTSALRNGLLKYQRVATDEQIFLMLVRGRVDVFPQQVDVGYHQIQALRKQGRISKVEAANITHFEKAYRSMPLYLLLSKKIARNKRMIAAFDRGMDRLHDLGRLD
jgi:polar amino acid transport system substrate-binding protein